jgi:aminoglycoside phosphotransferase (APT) family kinase protein
MFLLDPSTTERYLRDRGELEGNESVRVTELSGGVSNQVLLVERGRGDRFVLKQAREQLRVQQEWKCDVRRIWREMEVLRLCGEILRAAPTGPQTGIRPAVPEIVFEDRDNYCYAMTAAPKEHQTWKRRLLGGSVEFGLASTAGRMLASLHAETWRNPNIAQLLGDTSYFDALRVDPYYRRIAAVHPLLRDRIEALIESVLHTPLALVHGDFSPKNLLVSPRQMMLIDFEVGHFGDPAFDNGFFFSHLVLKAVHAEPLCLRNCNLAAASWTEYSNIMRRTVATEEFDALEQRSVQNLAGCLLARVDGKSPVDYLDKSQQERVRDLAEILFKESVSQMHDGMAQLIRVAKCS